VKEEIQKLQQSAIQAEQSVKDAAARSLDPTNWTQRVLNADAMWDGEVEAEEDVMAVGLMSQEELKSRKRQREQETEKEEMAQVEKSRVAKEKKKKKRAQDVNKLSFADIDE